jgi:hypothetical protein
MKSNNFDITDRFQDFFDRYTAFLTSLNERGAHETPAEELDLEVEKAQEKKLSEFSLEYNALKNEWDETEGLHESEINQITHFASVATAIADEIKKSVDSKNQSTQQEMGVIQKELVRLKQGKNHSKQFGPAQTDDAQIINRKA